MKCWSLLKCCSCKRIYNRDYNAARNIFKIAAAHIYGLHAFTDVNGGNGMSFEDIHSRPAYLKRAPAVPVAAGGVADASSDEDNN